MKAISFESIQIRIAAVILATGVALGAFFTFIWGFANTASANADLKEVGQLFAELSPSDPQTHFAAAVLYEKALEPGDFEAALKELEAATALSPHNYLLWLRLASARGRAGDASGTEAALRRAQELAPNYSRVNWALGNFLLREGKDDEGYSELRKAVAGDPSLASLAAATALQMSDGNVATVISRFENSSKIRISLSLQLAGQQKFDEAVAIWNKVEPENGEQYREAAKQMRNTLIENKKFAAALSLAGQPESTNGVTPEFEKITNPGFELPVKTQGGDPFDWVVTQDAYPQIGVTDAQKISGNFSLIALMSGQNFQDFRGPRQLVVVRGGGSYELVVNYKSDVRSAAQFHWEVASAKDGRRIALSPAMGGTPNWTKISIHFTVPGESEGVEIRFVRGECPSANCAAAGSFWFDDLSLNKK